MKTLILLFSFTISLNQAQKPLELKTTIKEATVFLQQAQVTRTGKRLLSPGVHVLSVANLSPYVDGESLKVSGKGDFTILSIKKLKKYPQQLTRDLRGDSIRTAIEDQEYKMSWHQARLKILEEQLDLLKVNRSLGSDQHPASVEDLATALKFYDQELTKINLESLKLKELIAEAKKTISDLKNRLALVINTHDLPNNEIEIKVEVPKSTLCNFEITYLVGQAGWYPKYDLRVSDLKSPVLVTYKAQVYQNTGVDWKQVKLKFSNAQPNKSGQVPKLQPWYLGRNPVASKAKEHNWQALSGKLTGVVVSPDGQPLPGVNILQKGSTNGTVTDIDGRYTIHLSPGSNKIVVSSIGFISKELDPRQAQGRIVLDEDVSTLNEVVVSGLSGRISGASVKKRREEKERAKERLERAMQGNLINAIATTTIENQTTVEIEVDKPYTLNAQAESILIDLKLLEIPANYQYYVVPKIDKEAFLVAQITNWDQYNLLTGEANLYFENSFVGKSILDTEFLKDTLDLSLGRDRSIVVSRTKKDHFSRRTFMGSNKVENREFELIIRNQKSEPISITVYDQVPISTRDQVEVNLLKLSSGQHDVTSGQIEWNLNIDPQEQAQFTLGYEVRSPKHQPIALE